MNLFLLWEDQENREMNPSTYQTKYSTFQMKCVQEAKCRFCFPQSLAPDAIAALQIASCFDAFPSTFWLKAGSTAVSESSHGEREETKHSQSLEKVWGRG